MRTSYIVAILVAVAVAVIAGAIVMNNNGGYEEADKSFTILHSNDTHCYLGDDDNLGFATLKALKDEAIADGETVFVFDSGDFLQGNVYGTMTKGEASVSVMNAVGYDLGIPGNHEFDYTFEVFMERASELNYPIICANLSTVPPVRAYSKSTRS